MTEDDAALRERQLDLDAGVLRTRELIQESRALILRSIAAMSTAPGYGPCSYWPGSDELPS
jgi:hypothetical protein